MSVRFTLRLSEELHALLDERARAAGRSLNTQIVSLCEQGLLGTIDLRDMPPIVPAIAPIAPDARARVTIPTSFAGACPRTPFHRRGVLCGTCGTVP